MDVIAVVLVRQKDSKYLLVDGAKNQLELPRRAATPNTDVISAAEVLLEEVKQL